MLHYGPSHGLVEYCQQIGRAGRSGEQMCHAVLYSYPQGSSIIAKPMRDYVKDGNSSCLRTRLFSPFNENNLNVPSISPCHRCCSFCSPSCNCGSDECTKVYFFEKVTDSELECHFKIVVREVTEEDRFNVADLLRNFHNSFDESIRSIPSAFLSGLTTPIIKEIISNLQYIDSAQYLLNTCIVDETWAQRIFDLIKNYFESGPSEPKKTTREIGQF